MNTELTIHQIEQWEAIDAAKECIKNPSAKNKKAAYSAMKQKILLYGVSLIKKG